MVTGRLLLAKGLAWLSNEGRTRENIGGHLNAKYLTEVSARRSNYGHRRFCSG
jgi:hypothetical protein